jgi:hypothetical protein
MSVVNLAVGSQAPPEYNRMLEVGARYHPARVLYCVFANDFTHDVSHAVPLSIENTYTRNASDKNLFLEDLSVSDRIYSLRKHISNLFLSFQIFKLRQQPMQKLNHVFWRDKDTDRFFAFAPKDFWREQVSYDSARVRAGVEYNVKLIQEADRFCKTWGGKLKVALFPAKEMVYGPLLDVGEQVYDDSYSETYRALANGLKACAIPCLDLTPELRVAAKRGQRLFFSIDGHFDEGGHEKLAELLSGFVGGP